MNSQVTYLDNFNTTSYTNNNGTANFATGWVEVNETTSPTGGRIQISSNQLRFRNLDNRSISRTLDLSAASAVTLTLDYQRTSGNETILVQLFDGTSYNTVATLSGGGASSISYNLTVSEISNASAIRFITGSGNWSNSETIIIDNVLFTATLTTIGLDTDGDGIDNDIDLDDDNDGIPDVDENQNCIGSVAPNIFIDEDYGTGNRTSFAYTNYCYENGLGTNPCGAFPGNTNVNDGEYAILQFAAPFNINTGGSSFPSWLTIGDHTGNPNGRMAVFNASIVAGQFYNRPVTGLVPNVNISVSFWALNVVRNGSGAILPNITYEIRDTSNNLIFTGTTGNIPENNSWNNYAFTFNPGANTQLSLILINNAPGGGGNDLALDDIQLSQLLCDTDSDGIPDQLDLDSDNDGIYDVVESGALNVAGVNDADNDGRIDIGAGSFGANGLYNNIENNDTQSAIISYTVTDSDSDGLRDAVELDSDNDNCNDVVEAGYTDDNDDGILGDDPTSVNTDGMVIASSIIDGYTNPRDGDSNSIFDFQENTPVIPLAGQPTNQIICDGGNGSFSVTTSGTGLLYQWQVSVDGGSTFNDLSNGGVYSNVTMATLNILGATGSMNGYRYRVNVINDSYLCFPGVPSNIVVLSIQAQPDAGTNGTLTVCEGTTPTDAQLFAELGGTPDAGGTWSNVGLTYTYTVTATAPCTGNDTATVTVTEQAEPDAGTNGTLTVCEGTTPTDAQLFAELGGTPDAGGTWSNVGLTYTYTVAATAPCTGNDTATVTVTEQAEPDAGTNGTLTVCEGTTPTDAQLFAELGGTPDAGGTWSNVGLTYTYTVAATAPCTGNDTATVTVTEQAEPDAGTNGTLTVCEGTTPTDAQLFAELGGTPDAGGTWTNVGLTYTYMVTATAPCTGNDTATVTVTEQAEPDAGTNGTLTVCEGTTPTNAQLFAELGGTPDAGGTWTNVGLTYTYTVTATAPCTGNDTATVTVTEQAEPDAGTNGTLTVCEGTTPTDAQLFAELGGTPDAGGTWSNVGLTYTYTVAATAPCTGNDTATVTVTEQAEPDAGTNGTLTVCEGTTPTDAQLFAQLGGTPDAGGTWSNVGLTYTYTVTATAPCTGNDTATVTVTEQAEPDAGTNGTLTVCEGTTPTDAQLFAELGGTPDAGGTWTNAGLTYTYTVTATAPCTGNDTATVTVTEQAEPDAGTNGTLTVCEGTTPTDAQLFAELGGTPDAGGTWTNVGLTYTYTVTATAPCTGNDTATVTVTEQAEPDAGTNGTLTVCEGTTPTDAQLFAELGGTPDAGGTWSNVGLVYTYTVTATAPCTGNDTATVTVTEQAEPDAGTNGTLTVCEGTTPTDAQLFAELGGTPDAGGTWTNVGLTYTYTVTATAPCTGNDTATVTVTEQAEPDAGTNGTLTVCEGTTPTDAQLFAELGGTPDAGGTWTNVGLTYTYTVTATAPCTGNDTATVTVTEQAEPDAGTNGTLTVCEGTTPTDAQLFAELGGTPDAGGTWSNVGLTYTYTVAATAPCTGNDTATVTVTEQAEPDAGTNGTLTVCEGTTPTDAQLFAELGGTPDAGGTWSNVGLTYTYTVAATAPCTGNDTATVTVTEQAEPDAGTNGTLTVCEGTTPTDAQLFAELGGTPDAGGTWSNVGLTYTYTVAATAPCTGNDTATVTVTEQAEPDAGTNGTLTVCEGTTPTDAQLFAELGGTPDAGGTWSNVGLTYTYTVTATAPCTGNDTATVTVTEQAEPDAGTNGTLTVCEGTTPTDAQLFAELGGTPDAGGTWTNVGLTYTYTVTATAPCTGNDTATVTVTEQAEPDAGTNGTLTVCEGTTPTDAQLFAELGGTPDAGGTWSNVGLTYTYTVAATAPCTGNDTATVTVTEQAEPDAGTNGTLTVCEGTTPTDAQLFAELGGTPDAGGTWSNVGLTYTYTVAATAPCTGNDTATVTVTEQAEPDAGTNGTLTVCEGTTPTDAQLFAELGGTPDAGGTWTNVGLTYTYMVTATAPCTGNDTATVTVTEQAEPDAGTNGTLTVCEGTTPTNAQLFAELGGTPDAGGTWTNVGLTYTYTVTATAPCTGNDTATVTVTEQAEPDAGTNGTLTVCEGTTPTDAQLFAELGGTPDAGGTWSNVGLTYTYTVAATAPCTGNDTATVTVTEQAEPDAGTNGTLTVCEGTTPTDAQLFAQLGGTPDAGGTWSNVGLTYTYTVAATAPCTGNDTATVTVTEQAPSIAISNGPICAIDLLSYQVEVTVSSGTVISTAGTVTNTSGNIWVISAITAGTNITLTVTDADTCTNTLAITAPNCSCPIVTAPTSGGDDEYCAGSTIPTLSASVGAGETLDWYDAASGGLLLLSNSTTYTPVTAGTYYAETRVVANGCTSATRTAVVLTENPLPAAPTSGGNQTECAANPIQTLTATATEPGGSTLVWYDAATGGSIVASPTLNTIGSVTYYAESRDNTSNCVSATRTAVSLTLQDCDADLSLRKTVDNATPDEGDSITFTITLRNDGPSTATNIIVQDIIPSDFTYTHPNFVTSQGAVTFNAGTGALNWNLGAFVLNVGSSLTLSYTLTVDVCGEFKNQVEIIQSSQTDPDSTPNNGK